MENNQMKKLISALAAASMIGAMTVASAAPAEAASMNQRMGMVDNYCRTHPRDNDCNDWHRNGHRWNDRSYQGFYTRHHSAFPNAAASIFGLAAGAIIAGAVNSANNNSSSAHIRACEARYRSYDARTDTFLSTNGRRYACNL
jgi:hypothetical protein